MEDIRNIGIHIQDMIVRFIDKELNIVKEGFSLDFLLLKGNIQREYYNGIFNYV